MKLPITFAGTLVQYINFSCDNWKSDVAVYSTSKSIIIDVATSRFPDSLPQVTVPENHPDFHPQKKAQYAALGTSELTRINGTCDGGQFKCTDLLDALVTLSTLACDGYHIPRTGMDLVTEEITND